MLIGATIVVAAYGWSYLKPIESYAGQNGFDTLAIRFIHGSTFGSILFSVGFLVFSYSLFKELKDNEN